MPNQVGLGRDKNGTTRRDTIKPRIGSVRAKGQQINGSVSGAAKIASVFLACLLSQRAR